MRRNVLPRTRSRQDHAKGATPRGKVARMPLIAAAGIALAALGLTLFSNATSYGRVAQDVEAKKPQPKVVPDIQKVVATATENETPDVKAGDEQDAIFLGDNRPVKMRFHLQVGDESFSARWTTYINSLFQDLDANKDGQLTLEEAKPVLLPAAQPTTRNSMPASNDPKLPKSAEKQLAAEPMTAETFAVAMRGSFFPLTSGTEAADNLQGNEQLIHALDMNGDKVLDVEELAAARKNLLTLDANDDEIVGSNELTGAGAPGTYVIGGGRPQVDPNMTQRLMVVTPGVGTDQIARKLVEQYDAGENKDGRLAASEINLGESFDSNDKDGDGALDLTELVAYVESSRPDLEVIARLSGKQQAQYSFTTDADDDEDDKDGNKKDGDEEKAQDLAKPTRAVQRMNLSDLPEDARKAIDEAREKAKKEGKPFELPEIAKKALEEARMKQDGKDSGTASKDNDSKDADSKDKDADDKDAKDKDEEEEPAAVNVNVSFDPSKLGQAGPRVWHLVSSETHDASLNAKVEETSSGLVIDLDRFRIEFSNSSGGMGGFTISRFEEQQFDAYDMDDNKYLDEQEAARTGSPFRLMDANADGMVFLEEYKGFLAKQKAAAESQLVATVEDHGHQLFKMLDTNADDRLSLREIYYAQQCLQAADQDGDGALALSEVPHNYQLKLGMGQQSMGGVFAVAITSGMQQQKPKSSVGPEWFSRMDKNGDGDISRREFLGSAEDFQRIDADNDELIDPKEAEAAVANNK